MGTRTALILLLCLVSATVLVTGCTSQTSGPVTTGPSTMAPGTRIQTTTSGTPSVSLTDDKAGRIQDQGQELCFCCFTDNGSRRITGHS